MNHLQNWIRALLVAATAKATMGLLSLVLAPSILEDATRLGYFNIEFYFFAVATFGSAAALLILGSQGDRGSLYLGFTFLIIATIYSNWPLEEASRQLATFEAPLLGLRAIHLDALLPLSFWLFSRYFPPGPAPYTRRLIRWGVGISAILGGSLLVWNLALLRFQMMPEPPLARWVLELTPHGSLYYLVLLTLLGGSFVVLGWKMLRARGESRRRVRLFITALLVGLGPFTLTALATIVTPSVDPLFRHGWLRPLLLPIALGFLSVPFTTAYAVLVHRVLDVKLIARQALQYLMARTTVMILTLVPLALLVAYLFQHLNQSLAELLSGGRTVALVGATVVGLTTFQYRRPLLDWIDRRFFRDTYDARQTLTELVDRIRNSRDERQMAALLVHGIDQALHLKGIWLLLEDRHAGMLVDSEGRIPPLDASSTLARLVARTRDPLIVDPDSRLSAARKLPESDREWLMTSGVQLLTPLVASDGSLLGLMALGEKRSAMPFLYEDRELLRTLATSAALGLEVHRYRIASEQAEADGSAIPGTVSSRGVRNARECPRCGRLYPPGTEHCGRCEQALATATVPYILPGKFRFEKRLGIGGMGVVYRAVDLALGRSVAVKTLHSVSPEHALRLRREAQTAAAVSHPNLAFIFGLETWGGTPLLVMELLENGTLADRIRHHRFPPAEVLDLGISMARALERLHDNEILHRDLKPSNIGYSRDGVPKLMDFGIARLQYDQRREHHDEGPAEDPAEQASTSFWSPFSDRPAGRRIVGTAVYLPPEVLAGAPFDPLVDLWGLALVLYECLRGGQILDGPDHPIEPVERVRRIKVPSLLHHRPDCPEALARLLVSALSRDRDRRPQSAGELAGRLIEIRSGSGA